MPKANSTRGTVFPASFSFAFAQWARLDASLREVSTMLFAVAFLTQGLPVGNIESQVGMCSPRLDVVSVNLAFCSAFDAGPVVASVDGDSPSFQQRGESGSLAFKRFAVLPCVSERAGSGFASTVAGAELSTPVKRDERDAAIVTRVSHRRVAFAPAGLRAILARLTQAALKLFVANRTYTLLATTAFKSSGSSHSHALYCIEYADVIKVILKRCEAEGMTVERAA